jgi:hypothetical protein
MNLIDPDKLPAIALADIGGNLEFYHRIQLTQNPKESPIIADGNHSLYKPFITCREIIKSKARAIKQEIRPEQIRFYRKLFQV